jgi:hypothetical protein
MVGPAAGRPAPAAAAQGPEAVHASSCVAYWGRTTRSPWGSAHQARRSGHVGSPGRLLPHCAGRTPPGHSPAGHEQTGAAVQSMQSKLNEPGAGTTMIILGGCRLLQCPSMKHACGCNLQSSTARQQGCRAKVQATLQWGSVLSTRCWPYTFSGACLLLYSHLHQSARTLLVLQPL